MFIRQPYTTSGLNHEGIGGKKFQSRYSGHLSSRLAWNGHNTTKQTKFPIIWREGLNGHSESMCWKHIGHEWLSIACTFMCIWGLNAVQTIPFGFVVLSSMPLTIGLRDGWLILDWVIDVSVYQDILTWDGLSQVIEMRSCFSGLFKSRTLWCSQCWRMWVTCW